MSASLAEGEARLPSHLWVGVLADLVTRLGPCFLGCCFLALRVEDARSLPSVQERCQRAEVAFRA